MFTDLNELMSSRIADVTVQVGFYIVRKFFCGSYTLH